VKEEHSLRRNPWLTERLLTHDAVQADLIEIAGTDFQQK
jgi:hypothetical protein